MPVREHAVSRCRHYGLADLIADAIAYALLLAGLVLVVAAAVLAAPLLLGWALYRWRARTR